MEVQWTLLKCEMFEIFNMNEKNVIAWIGFHNTTAYLSIIEDF